MLIWLGGDQRGEVSGVCKRERKRVRGNIDERKWGERALKREQRMERKR